MWRRLVTTGALAMVCACGSFGTAAPASEDNEQPTPSPGDVVDVALPSVPSGSGSSTPKTAPTTLGLVLHYPFEEGGGATTLDASGLGHDGSLVGVEWSVGKHGPALLFQANGRLTVNRTPALDLSKQMTIALFVTAQHAGYNQRLVSNAQGWELKLDGRRPYLGGDDKQVIIEEDLPTDEWHHVAITFDQGVAKGFIDGAAMRTRSSLGDSKSLATGSGTLTVGSAQGSETLRGAIGDLRIYTRALTPDEIAVIAAQ